MQHMIGTMARIALLIFAVMFSLVLLVDATSRVLQQYDAGMAIAINPLNSRARFQYVSQNIAEADDIAKLQVLKKTLIRGIEIDPTAASFYSLYGMIIEAEGDIAEAQNYYKHALSLIPSEGYALIRRIAFHARNNDFVEAVKLADLVFQRWKTRWPLVEPLLPIILQDEDAYQQAFEDFPKRERGKQSLLQGLIKTPTGLTLANRLLLDFHKAGSRDLGWETTLTLGRMIQAERYAEAYRLFVLTLDEDRKQDLGYVFNGSFREEPKDFSPFDWRLDAQSGVNISIKEKPNQGNQEVNALELRFLDKPTDLNTLRQHIRLPASKFLLSIKYSSDVKGPKPLKIAITCKSPQREVTQLILESTNGDIQSISNEFEIPAADCDLQFISLYNKNFSKSWQNRYSGILNLYNVSIELIDG